MRSLLILVGLVLCLGCCCPVPVKTQPPSSAPGATPLRADPPRDAEQPSGVDAAYRQRFADVAKMFTDQGASVDPMDPAAPYTMRVYLPFRVAMDMTSTQAKELAGLARTRLHDKAIVYVNSEGGQRLAKASPWGIE